mgnify:CR=1 FL=1
MKTTFGISSWSAPTPDKLKLVYRILLGLTGTYLACIEPRLNIAPETNLLIIKICSGISVATYYICNMFGVPKSELDEIKISTTAKVDAINEVVREIAPVVGNHDILNKETPIQEEKK